MSQHGNMAVRPEDIMPLFGQLFTRSLVESLLKEMEPEKELYWRALTPLVVMWGLVYQRLSHDHSCDEYLSHVLSGGVDDLDKEDPHQQPLSQRLRSENTSAYVQGRQRLPVSLLQQAWQMVAEEAEAIAGQAGRWQGLAVRLLDGTTFTLPAKGDIPAEYREVHNRFGPVEWIKVRAILACDYFSQVTVGLEERTFHSAETDMVPALLAQDRQKGALYLADQLYGIYRVVQAITGSGHHALLRMQAGHARALLKRQDDKRPLQSGESRRVVWSPSRHDQPFADWPAEPIVGRLIYWRIEEAGYRPTELYLFTTLLDEDSYASEALYTLYRQRWNVELRLRHLKSDLELDFFAVCSVQMFRKELAAGILAYNLICILLLQAAMRQQLRPAELSFKKCLRRILDVLTMGVPKWVYQETTVADYLLDRLGRCRLPQQPNKVKHEPRALRFKGRSYPTFRGSRQAAREAYAKSFKAEEDNS